MKGDAGHGQACFQLVSFVRKPVRKTDLFRLEMCVHARPAFLQIAVYTDVTWRKRETIVAVCSDNFLLLI